MTQRKTPCGTCPFARRTKPGTLGGSPIETFAGQAHGPFLLPCHQGKGYVQDADTVANDPERVEECAGAAIFRANVGATERLPEGLLRLDVDTLLVFATFDEFAQHHTCSSVRFTPHDIVACIYEELRQPEARRLEV